jgi:hypothetical protein
MFEEAGVPLITHLAVALVDVQELQGETKIR